MNQQTMDMLTEMRLTAMAKGVFLPVTGRLFQLAQL